MPQNENVDIAKLLKEYTMLKANIAKVKSAKYITAQKDSVQESINQFTNYITNTATRYGQSINETSEAYKLKEEYEGHIKEIRNTFENMHKEIFRKKLMLEMKEIKVNLQLMKEGYSSHVINYDEMEQNAKDGNFDNEEVEDNKTFKKEKLQIRKNEIIKEQEECEKQLEECEKEMKERLKFASAMREDKFHKLNDGYLVVLKKKNMFTRAFGWILNKVNGAQRFSNDILEPLKRGINDLKENKIPKIKKEVKEKTEKYIGKNKEEILEIEIEDSNEEKETGKIQEAKDYVSDKYNSVKETVENKLNVAKEYIIDKPKEKYNSIINYFNKQKNLAIDSMISTLKANNKEIPTKENNIDINEEK